MKIVFLDAKTIGEDIDLSDYDKLGQVVKYDFSTPDEIPERVKDAQVLVINKAPMNEKTLRQAEKLKLICVTATGTNNTGQGISGAKRDCLAECGGLLYSFRGTAYLCHVVLSHGTSEVL